jgi:competence protein ComEA
MDHSLTRYRPYIVMMLLFIIVLIGTVYVLRRPESTPATIVIVTHSPRPSATVASILVDVRGAVNKPGVYSLAAGSRLQDALTLAGDALPNADTRSLNLARKINDGEQIYVPLQGEIPPTVPSASGKSDTKSAATPTRAGKLNLNTATLQELDTLPGIGPVTAQAIIDYRNQNGAFKKIDDVKKVRGIGDSLYNQIKDLITLE